MSALIKQGGYFILHWGVTNEIHDFDTVNHTCDGKSAREDFEEEWTNKKVEYVKREKITEKNTNYNWDIHLNVLGFF